MIMMCMIMVIVIFMAMVIMGVFVVVTVVVIIIVRMVMIVVMVIMAVIVVAVVIMAVIVVVIFIIVFDGDRIDIVCGDDHRSLRAACLDQTIQEALKSKAVDNHQVSVGDSDNVCWYWLVNMSVFTRTNQRDDVDMLSTNLLNHIGENGETSDHIQWFSGCHCWR
jgi:energy-coupling factor transporter transmembrane protein EcfT